MSFWKPFDAMAQWLGRNMGAQAQLRFGILLCIISLPLYAWGPFSGEPLLIYMMSAFAITLTGIGIVVGAQVLVKQEEQEEDENPIQDGWPPPSP